MKKMLKPKGNQVRNRIRYHRGPRRDLLASYGVAERGINWPNENSKGSEIMSNPKNNSVTRRRVMAATGLSAIALAGLGRSASADNHEMSATEKANVKVVADFRKLWAAPDANGEKLAAYVADECVLRMEENKPAVEGRANAVVAFDAFFKGGQRFGIDVLDTFAIGPVVANSRSDYVVVPGKDPANRFAVAGVFILRDGKIHEWADYVVPKS